jgi:site-specific DNA-cytosine methylase
MASLSLRGIWLALEAWETPPALVLLENVPGITSRGSDWVRQMKGLLQGYGYAVAETTHCCGELGGLGQRRKRFLMLARHIEQVKSWVRVPPKRPLLSIGQVIGALPVPLPGSSAGGYMHRLPRMSAMNWVRLAYEVITGRGGYASMYKKDWSLKMLDPQGAVIEQMNSVLVTDLASAKRALRDGRNRALVYYRGVYRYIMFTTR